MLVIKTARASITIIFTTKPQELSRFGGQATNIVHTVQ